MRKNNKITLFTIIAIIITIIALIITSGTYAKYTSSINTTAATATVAKWSVKINGQDITTDQKLIEFNLFQYINDSDGIEDEEDVSDTKIAPGTSGSFNFAIENSSEVTIKYSIEFAETNASSIPIEYSIDGITYYDAAGLTEALNEEATEIEIGVTQNVEVKWRWAYEVNGLSSDSTDTALGKATTTPTYSVTAKIVATQVD